MKAWQKSLSTRPKVYNAFRPETNTEMIEAMDIAKEKQDIRTVILTGKGNKAFCSGGDQNIKGKGGYIGKDGIPRLNVLDLHKRIREIPKPVIAMVKWLCNRWRDTCYMWFVI